jgi:hypothetical protein
MKRTATIAAFLTGLVWFGTADAQQFPIFYEIAQTVVAKYENSSCDQLAAAKAQPKTAAEQRAIQLLHEKPEMAREFINRIAAPIANKLFECGFIP